jgi:HEAT repeat protein
MLNPLPIDFVKTLAQKLRDNQLVLFVGAGLSRQATPLDGSSRRLPSWNEFLSKIAASFGLNPDDYQMDPLTVLDYVEKVHKRHKLNDAVRSIIDDLAFEPSESHKLLSKLPWAAILTTNYDTLLDRSLSVSAVVHDDQFVAAMRQPQDQRPKLFKVHGSLENPHTLTARDYKNWALAHNKIYAFVQNLLISHTFLFVGYSLSDPHWKALLDVVEQIVGTDEKWLFGLFRAAKRPQIEMLREVKKINAASLSDDEYALAFRQISDEYRSLTSHDPTPVADTAQYAYDRQQYAQSVRRTYSFADLSAIYQWGAGFARDDVSLSDIFIEPDLSIPPSNKKETLFADSESKLVRAISDLERERQRIEAREYLETQERSPAKKVIAVTDRLLIVGAPGQGKSTLLRHILLEAIEKWQLDPVRAPFPCLIRLSRWAETDGPLEGKLSHYLKNELPGFAEISKEAALVWHNGNVLWLLDGIDEIRGGTSRQRFQEELGRLASPGSRHKFIVTTRPAGEPKGGLGAEWFRSELLPLSETQIINILRKWSAILLRKDNIFLNPIEFEKQLSRNTGLRQVRQNALLLTMAVLFFKQNKRLPNDRWEFYNGAEQSLRDSWARHRLTDHDAADLPGDYAVTVLETMALDGMLQGRVLFSADAVATTVRAVLATRSYTGGEVDREVPRFLDAARDAIGVLVEQAPDQYGFLHLTFQEFLAARALIKRSADAPAVIKEKWFHSDWRETWLLYALGCQEHQGKFSELFKIILKESSRHALDNIIFRPERVAINLAGVGRENLPPTIGIGMKWAIAALSDKAHKDTWAVLNLLDKWERQWPNELCELVIDLTTQKNRIRFHAARALGRHADSQTARDVLLSICANNEEDIRLREIAIEALGRHVDDPKIRKALLGFCDSKLPRLRAPALEALGSKIQDADVWPQLIRALKDNADQVRYTGQTLLREHVDVTSVTTTLLEFLSHKSIRLNAVAVEKLSEHTDPAVVEEALIFASKHARKEVRRIGALASRAHTDNPRIKEALLSACGDSEDVVRSAALTALAPLLNAPEIHQILITATSDKSEFVRGTAIRLLSGQPEDRMVKDLLLKISNIDKSNNVRYMCLSALSAYTQYMDVKERLISACEEKDSTIRGVAIRSLTPLAHEGDVRDALLKCITEKEPFALHSAITALTTQVHEIPVQQAMLQLAKGRKAHVQSAALSALSIVADDPRIRPSILALTRNRNWGVRAEAVRILGGIKVDELILKILINSMSDSDEDVRATARMALEVYIQDDSHDGSSMRYAS